MWQPIFELAKTTSMVLTITADERLLTVTVNPTPASKEAPPALSQPLVLKATPEELDAGFVDALTTYGKAYATLKETVEASVAVMEEAKKASASKAVGKGTVGASGKKVVGGAAPAPAVAVEAAEDGDDGDGSPDEAGSAAPTAQSPQAADKHTINLFA